VITARRRHAPPGVNFLYPDPSQTMKRRAFLAAPAILRARSSAAADRPNILWILGDDLGVELSSYGHPLVKTPNMDRLAAEGVRFTRCHTTAPVCSASRSAFNVGLYQIATGTHNHRSHRKDPYSLPSPARLITDRFRERGYFTANVLDFAPGCRGTGKTDFNFQTAGKPFDGTHWNQRGPGQPFFAQINFQAPHKGPAFTEARRRKELIDPDKVELPPYYPDHPVVRDEFANYLDAVQLLDDKVGVLMDTLRRDGALENTAIFLFGDNGRCLLRSKQWLYDGGTHVPLIVRWPGAIKPGTVRDELCTALDMNATSLYAAGIPVPEGYHGRPLLGPAARPRDLVFTARDRCDMTVDRIRAVRDRRYTYIRNCLPDRPYTQWNEYIETSYPTLQVLLDLHKAGKLNAAQELWMAPRRPPVEFYDTQSDPHQVHNLAGSTAHQKIIADFGRRLDAWLTGMKDQGATLESRETVLREEPRAADPRATPIQ
jgi:arylsulfatase A-like enzyme